ncbi:MAG TPA: hypothetical protein VGL91_23760 [Acidobacteriota bacterium]|jgi:hypothetical protein
MFYLRWIIILLLAITLTPILLAQNVARTEAIFPLFVRVSIPIDLNIAPQYADADAFHSRFVLINPNPSDARLSLQVFDSSGHEVDLRPSGISFALVKSNSFFGFFGDTFQPPSTIIVGWAKITSTQPLIIQEEIFHSLDQVIAFGNPRETVKARVLKQAANPVRRAAVEVRVLAPEFGGTAGTTGISIVFPSSSPTASNIGTLSLRNQFGKKLAERQVTIAANNQIFGVFTELFPDVPVSVTRGGAILELNFDQEVFIAAVNFRISRLKEEMDEPNIGTIQ